MKKKTLRDDIPILRRKVLKRSFTKFLKFMAFFGILTLLGWAVIQYVIGIDDKNSTNIGILAICWFIVVLLISLSSMIYETLFFLTYHYDMDESTLTIRKGVLIKREVTLPLVQITDVYVDQDIPDFILGIYDVHFSTPTVQSFLHAHIDGVSRKGAALLKQTVLDKIQKARSKLK